MNGPKPYLKFIISPNNPPIDNHLLAQVESSDKKCIEIAVRTIKLSREFDDTDIRTDSTYTTQTTNITKYVFHFRMKLGTRLNDFLHHISLEVNDALSKQGIKCWITYDQIIEPQAKANY